MVGLFDRLLDRAERCHALAAHLSTLIPNSQYKRVSMPRPEQVLLEEALHLESEAKVRAQLGDLPKARFLYMYSVSLMKGLR